MSKIFCSCSGLSLPKNKNSPTNRQKALFIKKSRSGETNRNKRRRVDIADFRDFRLPLRSSSIVLQSPGTIANRMGDDRLHRSFGLIGEASTNRNQFEGSFSWGMNAYHHYLRAKNGRKLSQISLQPPQMNALLKNLFKKLPKQLILVFGAYISIQVSKTRSIFSSFSQWLLAVTIRRLS